MTADAILDRYAGVVFDVDGVLCRGQRALPGAPEVLAVLREHGHGIALVTNNASRTPTQVVHWLRGMGLHVRPEEVITSSIAAARMLAPGTRCVVIGSDGLREALGERGIPEETDPQRAEAVVVGLDPELRYADLRRATLALHAGARFLGTNGDCTFPGADGLWPGNGAILAALTAATGRDPEIAGKPEAAVFEAAAAEIGRTPLLMVGDRVDTDIAGAAALGWDTALVLTGVTAPEEAGAAGATWVVDRLDALLEPPLAGRGGADEVLEGRSGG